MTRIVSFVALVLSCGCATADRHHSRPPLLVPAPGGASQPSAGPVEHAAPLEPIADPRSVACELRDRILFTSDNPPRLRLCFDRQGPCYAEAESPLQLPVRVVIAQGGDPSALIEVEQEGVELRGIIAAESLMLFRARPFTLADFVIPHSVRVIRGEPSALRVTVDLDASVEPRIPPERTLLCADLSLQSQWLEQDELLRATGIDAAGARGRGKLSGASVELALSAARSAPVAILHADGTEVETFGVQASSTRIGLFQENGAFVFGWVPSRALTTAGPAKTGFGASGRGNAWLTRREVNVGYRCPHEVALAADANGTRRQVGRIRKNVSFRAEPFAGDRAFFEIELPALIAERSGDPPRRIEDVRAARGTRFLVRRSDIKGCREP